MQSRRRQKDGKAKRNEKVKLPYECPEIIYKGKISIRAGSPFGGKLGPPSGPVDVPGN